MWVFLLARVVRINAEKSLALTHQAPEQQFLQSGFGSWKEQIFF